MKIMEVIWVETNLYCDKITCFCNMTIIVKYLLSQKLNKKLIDHQPLDYPNVFISKKGYRCK
jgi:hypothetical protein